MQLRFSKDQLAQAFPEIEADKIDKAWYALKIINDLNADWDSWVATHIPEYPLYIKLNSRRLEAVMYFCDRTLECHGVENIRQENSYISHYWMDTVALYLNTGDTYNATIVADLENTEFLLTTYGDFVEQLEK